MPLSGSLVINPDSVQRKGRSKGNALKLRYSNCALPQNASFAFIHEGTEIVSEEEKNKLTVTRRGGGEGGGGVERRRRRERRDETREAEVLSYSDGGSGFGDQQRRDGGGGAELGVGLGSGIGFEALGLNPTLVRRLSEGGVVEPTKIQQSAIPPLLQGHDAALQSFTGSGKTLAFLLPILNAVGPLRARSSSDGAETAKEKRGAGGGGGVEAVIVAPSRELAMQIVREAERILGPENRKAVQQLIGGANQRRQEEDLKANRPTIVVGTPGRIADISRSGRLRTHGCLFLVLDEADALLSHKFQLDMLRLLDHVGRRRKDVQNDARTAEEERKVRQTVLVSATMPPAVISAAKKWGYSPKIITAEGVNAVLEPDLVSNQFSFPIVGSNAPTSDARHGTLYAMEGIKNSLPPNITHSYVVAPQRHKVEVVRKCINALEARQVVLFMNFQQRLKDAQHKLSARGISAACLHGGLTKVDRANVLSGFRDGKFRVLVVSEVAARGIDVMGCDLVVNLELPTDASHYAHRAGRTGRLGRQGVVVTVCEEREAFVAQKLGRQLGVSMTQVEFVEGKMLEFEGRMKF